MNVSVDNMSSSLILTCEERRYIGRITVDFDTEAIFLVGYLILLVTFSTCTFNGFLIILMVITIKSLHQTVYFLVVVLDFRLSIFNCITILIFEIPEKVSDHPVLNGLGYFTLFCYFACGS